MPGGPSLESTPGDVANSLDISHRRAAVFLDQATHEIARAPGDGLV